MTARTARRHPGRRPRQPRCHVCGAICEPPVAGAAVQGKPLGPICVRCREMVGWAQTDTMLDGMGKPEKGNP